MRDVGVTLLALLCVTVQAVAAQEPPLVRAPALEPSRRLPLSVDTLLAFDGSAPGPDGRREEPFGVISAVAVDGRGRVAVVDFAQRKVRVFQSDGTRIISLGREGDGPGEFRLPSHAAFSPDGRLYVLDQSNNRVTEYTHDYRIARSLTLSVVFQVASFLVIGDRFFLTGIAMVGPSAMRGRTIHAFSRNDGSYLASFGHGIEGLGPEVARFIGGGNLTLSRDGQLWYSQAAPYLIEKYTLDGRMLVRIERPNGFLPSADRAVSVAVSDSGIAVSARTHPRALAVVESGDSALIQQVNPMDGTLVTDWYVVGKRGPLDITLTRSWRASMPVLLAQLPNRREFVGLLGGGDVPYSVAVLRMRWRS